MFVCVAEASASEAAEVEGTSKCYAHTNNQTCPLRLLLMQQFIIVNKNGEEKNLLSKNKHWDEKNLPRDLNERKTLTLMTSFFSRPLEFLTPHGLDGGHRKGGQKC